MAQSRKLKGLSTDLHEIFVGSPLWMGIPLWMALPQRITGTTPPAVRFSQYTFSDWTPSRHSVRRSHTAFHRRH
jgi:hypothetical protein